MVTKARFALEWIWGDDNGTTVYAQGYGAGHTVIFRFQDDSTQSRSSLANRIVTCYHDLEAPDSASTFPNRASMRQALYTAIHLVWCGCIRVPAISCLDVVVSIDALPNKPILWSMDHHPSFRTFIRCLREVQAKQPYSLDVSKSVDFAALTRLEQIGGRGCVTKVLVNRNPQTFYVFKGIDFRTFLTYSNDEQTGEDEISHLIKTWHHEHRQLSSMPAHPNILPRPSRLVTIQLDHSPPVVCGHLYPFHPNRDLGSLITSSNNTGIPIPLSLKARWCHQMADAVKHTHHTAHTYHMDIRPENFLLDDYQNLLLIDWEQSDASPATLAPEADGTFDVKAFYYSGMKNKLQYTKYRGPARQNTAMDIGGRTWNMWNVFPLWRTEHPRALELAEVYSLGRSMWMLLCQPDVDDVEHPDDLVAEWTGCPEDVPEVWKLMVDRCLARDPNERPGLVALTAFWERTAIFEAATF